MVVNITFLSFLLFSMCKSIHDAVNTWINCSFFNINNRLSLDFEVIFFQFLPLPANRLMYSVSQTPPLKFSDIFLKRLEIFSPNFTGLLYIPIYAGLQMLIQLSATLTKLCPTKRDHHNVLKMSTIDRNARWVVALNMA